MASNSCYAGDHIPTSSEFVGTIYVTMISSLCSMLGSSLIIVTFIVWPDLRTTARAILVFLAIADFLTAAGYLFASILFLISNYTDSPISPSLCTFQSFITTTFPISSFLWTANLAIYLFVSITLQKVKLARRLMLLFHITAWGIPLLLCIPGAATGKLGDNNISSHRPEQGSVAWCWVSFDNRFDNNITVSEARERLTKLHVLELVFGKFWEISVFFLSIIICIVVKISLRKRKKQVTDGVTTESTSYGSINSERMKAALNQLDQRLIWIPIVFVLVRCWGTVRWIIASTSVCMEINQECSIITGRIWFVPSCYNAIYNQGLLYMQAMGDTGQGWANALLYVVFHATIARRVCPCLFFCWNKLKKKYDSYRHKRDYTPMGDSEKEEVEVALSTSGQSALTETEDETISKDVQYEYYPAHMAPEQRSINSGTNYNS